VRSILPMIALLLAPVSGRSQEGLSFLQMSDPQFGMYTGNKDFAQETANFELAIATANRMRPSFVAVCGDLVNRAGDSAQIEEFWRIAHKLDRGIALYTAAGNHDVGNSPTPESLAAYRRKFGKDFYAFTYPGFEGIVLNSSLIQHPENAPEDAAQQQKWLEAELAAARQSHVPLIAVFQHIPFFIRDADEPDQYFNIPKTTRAKYLDMLGQSGVRYVFAGHLHYAASGAFGPLRMLSSGPVGMPMDSGASGLRIARIAPGGIEERYFDFGHMPNSIDSAFPRGQATAPQRGAVR
jgi:3',5'-cyclic AMP phosphodiesterase CpdA